MAGETPILEVTFDNVAQADFQPFQVVEIDAANSDSLITAAKLPAAAGSECIGVCYDKAKLDQSGDPVAGSGINVRTDGFARVVAASAINAGDYVSVANATGQVKTQAAAAAGAVLVPVVGRAIQAATAAGDRIVVKLMIGGRV